MMNRGLFGRHPAFQTPGIGDGLPGMPERLPDMRYVPTTAGGAFGDPFPQPKQRAGLGTRLLGQGWEGKVAALGGALMGDANAVPGYMQGQQLMAFRQAEAQRQRAAELADYTTKKEIDARYASPEKDAFDRALVNAGIDPSRPRGVELYRQRAMTLAQGQPPEPRMVTLPDGRAVFGTMDEIKSVLGGNAPAQRPSRPVGGLTPISGGTGSNVGGGFR